MMLTGFGRYLKVNLKRHVVRKFYLWSDMTETGFMLHCNWIGWHLEVISSRPLRAGEYSSYNGLTVADIN